MRLDGYSAQSLMIVFVKVPDAPRCGGRGYTISALTFYALTGITNGIFNLKGVSKKKKDAVTCTVTGQPKAGGGYEIPLVVIALQLQLGSTSRIEYLQLGTGRTTSRV